MDVRSGIIGFAKGGVRMSTVSAAAPFHTERVPVWLPIWREALAGVDWLALRSSPVFYGFGVPHGDGAPVVLVPGFMGNDYYLYEMYFWLKRIGYRPYMSNIGVNADCLNLLIGKLSSTINKAHVETGRQVHMIGHSLGGVLARSMTVRHPQWVASVTTLGSPFRGISSHPLVLQTADRVRKRIVKKKNLEATPDCYTSLCDCEAVNNMQEIFPNSVRQTAIYTKTDGIVDWKVCITDNPESNFEVRGTHVGLVFNASVYQLVATHMASK